MFIVRIFLCFLIFGQTVAYSANNVQPEYLLARTPTWVKAIVYDSSTQHIHQQAINYILMDDQINTLNGLEQYRHRVISPLTTIGLEQVSELKLRFNPAFEQLTIHQILIKRNSQIRDVTNSAKIRIIHREEQLHEGIHDGQATAIVILNDVRVGDIIDYSYSVTGSNPIFSNKRFGYLPIDMPLDVATLSIRLLVPAQQQTQVKIFNNNSVTINKTSSANIDEYSLYRQNVSAITPEEATPAWYAHYGWFEYSQYHSWADVNEWAQGLYNIPIKSTAIFESTYQQLVQKSKNKDDFITNALFFVQNDIRYLGLEFGENSHKPHTPTDVLKDRYGDCKDKALLLSQLLQRHGITALPALVSTQFQKGIVNELPSPGVFNHAVTYVQYNNKAYWLDGTRRYQAGSLDTLGIQDFGVALVIGHHDKNLITMYEHQPSKIYMEIEEHIYAKDFNGTVDYQITSILHGNAAESQREYFANTSPTTIHQAYANFYSKFHEELSIVKPLEYENDPINNRFIIKEYYQLHGFWGNEHYNQNPILKAPITLKAFTDQIYIPQSISRKSPLALASPKTISSRIYLHFPTDVKLDLDDKVLSIENSAVKFNTLDRYYNKTYYNHSELTIKQNHIDTEKFKAFSKDIREVNKLLDYSIYISSPDTNGYKEILTLKQKFQDSN